MTDEIDLANPQTYCPTETAYNRYLTVNADMRQRNSAARKDTGQPMLVALAKHKLSPDLVGILD